MARILKLLATALVVVLAATAGAVFVVAVVVAIGLLWLARSLFRRAPRRHDPARRSPGVAAADVIDVVATEVPEPKR